MIGHESRKYTKTYKSSQQDIDEGIPQTIIERKMKKQEDEEDDEKRNKHIFQSVNMQYNRSKK